MCVWCWCVKVDVVVGADAVQPGNLRLRRMSTIHSTPQPGRLGRDGDVLLAVNQLVVQCVH